MRHVILKKSTTRIQLAMVRFLLLTLGLGLFLLLSVPGVVHAQPASDNVDVPQAPADAAEPFAAMGLLMAEVGTDTVIVQVRLTASEGLVEGDVPGAWGVVEYQIFKEGEKQSVATQLERALPHHDFITRTRFVGLEPGTRYVCRTRIGLTKDTLRAGPTGTFETHYGGDSASTFRFVVVTGMNYAKFHGDSNIDLVQHQRENNSAVPKPYDGPDKALGYPALETIANMEPNLFIGTGDNVYYDTPDATRAKTVPAMRRKWHEQFVQPRYLRLFAKVPTMWMVDDHDYRIDDADNAGYFLPLPSTSYTMMLEQVPYGTFQEPAPKTYRTVRVNKDLQLWLPENRLYRSPNAEPDVKGKTIWGRQQKAWLKRTLRASDATFKLLVSPTPMIGPDDKRKNDNHVDINGFQTEQREFFDFLAQAGLDKSGFYMVCGDRHWQYHAINPRGLEEFSCGALVDANSRLARMPGDPQGTDPNALIKHLHVQKEPSGGFLMVTVNPAGPSKPAQLTFAFYDERGNELYSVSKAAPGR